MHVLTSIHGKRLGLGQDGSLILDKGGVQRLLPVTRIVTETGTTIAVTKDEHEGRTILMSETGGDAAATYTLPAATGSGDKYRFVVGVVNTSNYVITMASGTFEGSILVNQDGADTVVSFNADSSDDKTITLNGTTTGGVAVGDWVEVEDIASGMWAVRGHVTGSGTEATMFS